MAHLFDAAEFPLVTELAVGYNKEFLHYYIYELKLNNSLVGFFLGSPHLAQTRILRLYLCKLFQLPNDSKPPAKILSTFLDFVWAQDPCDEIHVLQLKDYKDQRMLDVLRELKMETATFEPPFPELSPEYLVQRRKKKCKNEDL